MQQERISDNVYWFQSDNYAQVTSGLVVGPEWGVVIDTLPFPEETLAIRDFIEQEIRVPIRYVILTHYHADHGWGSCFFPGATVVGHTLCRDLLESRGKPSLEEVSKSNPMFRQMEIVLPQMVFQSGTIVLRIGKKRLRLMHLPGHSPDGIGVFIEEDRALFAGDLCMPIPYLVDGDYDQMVASFKQIGKMSLENAVQGHGDIVLRGEIESMVKDNLAYLAAIRKAVRKSGRRKYPMDLLKTVDVESCGKSRVLLGGLAEELHQRNLKALYQQLFGEPPRAYPEEEYD